MPPVSCTSDSSSSSKVDINGLLTTFGRESDYHRYAPPQSTATELSPSDEHDEWAEIEQMGPSATDLIRLVQKFPAPYDWD
jgi:hypothetical protein